MIFGFGSRVLMISPIFLLVKIGCKETPIFELRSCSCLLLLSAALWLMKEIENITAGVVSLFLSASLCTLSVATLVINWFTVERNQLTLVFYYTFITYKKGLLKTMLDRAYRLSSKWKQFINECEALKLTFSNLLYPSQLIETTVNQFITLKISAS